MGRRFGALRGGLAAAAEAEGQANAIQGLQEEKAALEAEVQRVRTEMEAQLRQAEQEWDARVSELKEASAATAAERELQAARRVEELEQGLLGMEREVDVLQGKLREQARPSLRMPAPSSCQCPSFAPPRSSTCTAS